MSQDFEDDEPHGNGAAWMATFADMMTLLLTFFVLLISFANMDVIKFQMMLGSVKDAMGVRNEHPGVLPTLATVPVPLSDRESTDRIALMEELAMVNELRRQIRDAGLDELVEAELGQRGVIVRVTGHVLYDLGSAELKEEGLPLLDSIASIANKFETNLLVEGHTDDLPISTPIFPSNWELSTARAISAMRYLAGANLLPAERLGVAGYAEMRPVVPNDTVEHRSQNRRVEFVFIRTMKPDVLNVSHGGPDDLTPSDWIAPQAIPLVPPTLVPTSPRGVPTVPSNE
jgi:chemotaxis protein MotB